MNQSEQQLYQLIETALKSRPDWVATCRDLYEIPEIHAAAPSAYRVSDYLGNMWRKKLLTRQPAPRGSGGSRWSYQWKEQPQQQKVAPQVYETSEIKTPTESRSPQPAATAATAAPIFSRRIINIPDDLDEEIEINLPHATIIIRPRRR